MYSVPAILWFGGATDCWSYVCKKHMFLFLEFWWLNCKISLHMQLLPKKKRHAYTILLFWLLTTPFRLISKPLYCNLTDIYMSIYWLSTYRVQTILAPYTYTVRSKTFDYLILFMDNPFYWDSYFFCLDQCKSIVRATESLFLKQSPVFAWKCCLHSYILVHQIW